MQQPRSCELRGELAGTLLEHGFLMLYDQCRGGGVALPVTTCAIVGEPFSPWL